MRFITLFGDTLRARRGLIIGWGAALLVLALYLVLLHDSFVLQEEQFASILDAYPPEMMAAFGGTADLFTPQGFLNFTYFSYVAVLLGFLAVSLGSGLLAADEERGRLELTAAYPLSRASLFFARLLAALAAMIVILVLSWLGFALFLPGTGLAEISAGQIVLPHLELLAFMLFFAGLALLLSQLLPSRSAASAASAVILLASYVLRVLLQLDEGLAEIERFSPLHYVKGGYAIDGLNAAWALGLAGAGLAFILLAYCRFQRRDLRVSGEGSWPAWLRLGRRA